MGKLGKVHRMKTNIEAYSYLIMGDRKIGKTTLVCNIAKEEYGSLDKLLVLSIGDEDGFEAIDGLVYENPRTWNEFVYMIDELVENQDDYDFKLISIDTIDEVVRLATDETIRRSNLKHKDNPDKKTETINGAFGGYYAGPKYMFDLVTKELQKIRDSKYGLFMVGHNKVKKRKDTSLDEGYDIVTSNLSTDEFNTFAYKSTLICNITLERDPENPAETTRLMNFRSDGIIDAGSRFTKLPVGVPISAKSFINVVKEAVKYAKNIKTDKEYNKQAKADLKLQEQEAKNRASSHKAETKEEPIEVDRDAIVKAFPSVYREQSQETKDKFMKKLKATGCSKITELDDKEFKEIFEFWNEIIEK